MKDIFYLLLHLLTTIAKLIRCFNIIDGSNIVAACSSCQWQLEIGTRQGQGGLFDIVTP
mgnify:CR=1